MDLSPHANILDIRRLIQKFDDININLFKQCLLDQTGCENENEWLCYVIRFLPQALTPQSIATLRNRTIEIAETQTDNPETTNKKKHYSLYKSIQQQYKDKLSHLPSDIIDHIGTYLNKIESIEFGYLNKQLYIESQKQSYLNKRWNDKVLILKDEMIDKLFWKESNPFSYSMPAVLRVNGGSQKFFASHWFRSMFTRLTRLECRMLDCLPYIPLKMLFSLKNTNGDCHDHCSKKLSNVNPYANITKNNNECRCNYLEFGLYMNDISIPISENVAPFCQRFIKFSNEMKDEGKQMGGINKLYILGTAGGHDNYTYGFGVYNQDYIALIKKNINDLLITFGPVSQEMELENCHFNICNYNDELEQTFGKIRKLSVRGNFSGEIVRKNNNTCLEYRLEEITRDLNVIDSGGDGKFLNFLSMLVNYGITQRVKRYTLVCSTRIRTRLRRVNNTTHEADNLNEILFNLYDKHLLLKTIVIKISDTLSLDGMANIFLYLIDKRKQLLNPLTCRIENIQIDISVKEPCYLGSYRSRPVFTITPVNGNEHDIFTFDKDEDYDIEKQKVEITVSKCDIQQFGIIYQNVIHWLKNISQQKPTDDKNINHRIVSIKIARK